MSSWREAPGCKCRIAGRARRGHPPARGARVTRARARARQPANGSVRFSNQALASPSTSGSRRSRTVAW